MVTVGYEFAFYQRNGVTPFNMIRLLVDGEKKRTIESTTDTVIIKKTIESNAIHGSGVKVFKKEGYTVKVITGSILKSELDLLKSMKKRDNVYYKDPESDGKVELIKIEPSSSKIVKYVDVTVEMVVI